MSKMKVKPKVIKVTLKDLNPAEYNPRVISDEALAGLDKSIEKFGCVELIVVNVRGGKNIIVGGHQRYKVLREKHKSNYKIECIAVDLSNKDKKLLNVTLNNPGLQGEFSDDIEKLIAELAEQMSEDDYTDFRLDELVEELESEIEGYVDDDEVPVVPKKAKTKKGDLWLLGEHRLLCGDSTKKEDVERLMDGKKADMIFTEPPYNVNYTGQNGMKIDNDNMNDADFYQFLYDAFVNFINYSKPGAAIYVAHADIEGLNFRKAINMAGFKLSGCLIWKKPQLVLGRSDYQWQHEPILYGWNPAGTHFWKGGRKQTTILNETDVVEKISDREYLIKTSIGNIYLTGDNVKFDEVITSIIEFDKPQANKEHPTMKPVELILKFLKNSSKKQQQILDLFLGSGSTLIACEKVGRKCYGMEIDPVYCDVIVQRWQNWTGQKAKLAK